MLPLAETQRTIHDAVVDGATVACAPLLVGGQVPLKRLAVHQRHYEASLVQALLTKFPGCVWLAGSTVVTDAARRYVHSHPPQRPCIAEYGEEFPGFLDRQDSAAALPYLRNFGELEWRVGQVSIAVDAPPIIPTRLQHLGTDLPAARLVLQPGVRYLQAEWPVDELLRFFVTNSAPEQYALATGNVWLEVRGARGIFRTQRLEPGAFAFRAALVNGRTLGSAAECGSDADKDFDAGRALGALLSDELVTGVLVEEEDR